MDARTQRRLGITATSLGIAAPAAAGGKPIALVVGVGPLEGIGGACAKKMADEGYHVVMLGRTQATMDATLASVEANGGSGTVIIMASIGASAGFGVATSDMPLMEEEVVKGFDVACGMGELKFVCQNQGPNMPPPTGRDMREMTLEFVTYMWEMNMGVSFVVGREAARRMTGDGGSGGTLIFTGATGALRGKPPFIAFAQGKAGVRMLAQSMSREFAPEGLHVAHVIIDGGVGGSRLGDPNPFAPEGRDVEAAAENGTMLAPDACAESFYQLHLQHPSAWTQEMELRPMKETW